MATANTDNSPLTPSFAAPLLLLAAFASLWWLLPRLLSLLCWRAIVGIFAGTVSPTQTEASLVAELRQNRQERQTLSNTEANFVAISRLDRKANRLRSELAPLRDARVGRLALANTGASLVARGLSNWAAMYFLYASRGVAVMRLPLLADWFAPFHWLLTLGGEAKDCLTSSSLILLCLGCVSLASGLARITTSSNSSSSSSSSHGGSGDGMDAFMAAATAAVKEDAAALIGEDSALLD